MKQRTPRASKLPAARSPKYTKRSESELLNPVKPTPPRRRTWLPNWQVVCVALIAACFAFTRLYNLLGLPIFLDEAFFLNWANDVHTNLPAWGLNSPDFWRAINRPIMEGKFLHAILYLVVTPWAPVPLLAARLVSVVAGALTLAGCYVIGKRLFDAPTGLLAAFVYVFCPLAVFNDRLASPDSLLCAAATWILASSIATVQEPVRRHFIVLGLAMGLAPLTKTSGIIAFAIPAIIYVLFLGVKRPSVEVTKSILAACGIAAICIGVVYIPSYLLAAEKPGSRVVYLTAFSGGGPGLLQMLAEFGQHMAEALGWMKIYLTMPVLVIALAGFAFALAKRERNILLLASVFAILFCVLIFLAKVLFSRYLLWAAPPLLVLAAATSLRAVGALGRARNFAFGRVAIGAVAVLLAFPAIRTSYGYITDCTHADLPQADRIQYVEGWPSGYAVRQAAEFLEREARSTEAGIDVVCQEYGATSHLGTRVLLSRDPNITVRYSPLRGDGAFAELAQWTSVRPAYLLVETPPLGNTPEEQPDMDRLRKTAKQIKVFLKPGSRRSVNVYYVPPARSGGSTMSSADPRNRDASAYPTHREGTKTYRFLSGNVFLVGLLAILQLSFLHGALLLFWLDRKRAIQSPAELAVYAFAISPFVNFLITLAATGLQQLHESYFITDLLFYAITAAEILLFGGIVWRELTTRPRPSETRGKRVYSTAALFATAVATAATLYALSGLNPILNGFYNDEPITWNVWAYSWYMSSIPEYTNQYGQLVPTGWALIYRYTHNLGIAAFVKAWMTEFSFYLILLAFLVGRATRRGRYYVAGVAVWLAVAAAVWMRSAIYAGYAHTLWAWIAFASFHVDLQVAFYGFLVICTLLIAREAPPKASRFYYVLAILMVAGGAATKQAGLFVAAVTPVLGYALVIHQWPDRTPRQKALFLLGTSLLIAVLACPTYIVNQHMIDIGKNGKNLDIPNRMARISPTVVGRISAALEMLAPFFGGPTILVLATGLFLIGMCSAEGLWIGAVYVLPYAYIWAAFVSYDTTNFATAAPAYGLVSGLGAARIGGYVWRRVFGGRAWTPGRGWLGLSGSRWARFGGRAGLAAAGGVLLLVILAVNSRVTIDLLRSREAKLFAKNSPAFYSGGSNSYFADRALGRTPTSGPSGPDRLSAAEPQPCQFVSSYPNPIYGPGFYPAEGEGSVKHRWARKASSLWLVMAAGGECALTFQLVSPSATARVRVAVRVNGVPSGFVEARSSDFAKPTIQGLAVMLQSGRNEITLESEEEEVTFSSDLRSAAYAIVLPPAVGRGLVNRAPSNGGKGRTGAARFLAADSETRGAWKGAYGIDGYAVNGDLSSLPLYARLDFEGQDSRTWAASSADVRALQRSAGNDRVAGAWHASGGFTIDVDITDGSLHQVALYAVDWEHRPGAERIDVLDGATGAELDTRTLSAFSEGEFLVWSIKGHVTFRVTGIAGDAAVSGIFFGGGRGGPGTASFAGEDGTTKGSWKGVYGSDGFAISGDVTSLPPYAQLDLAGQSLGIPASSTTDVRALQKGTSDDRIASMWLTWSSMTIDVNLTGQKTRRVALYAAGLDADPRTERIEVLDAVTGKVLDTRVISEFPAGKYLIWDVSGHVSFRVSKMVNDAVVSGVFFQ